MIPARWNKIINDLWGNRTRTGLIVLSIAVGLFAVGTIGGARTILSTEMARSFAAIQPSSGTVRTLQTFDEGFMRSMGTVEGVALVDARRTIQARIRVGDGPWTNILIFAVPDYNGMKVNIVRPVSGAWPPPERQILIERAALPVLAAQVGDVALVEFPNGQQRSLPIAGSVHDMAQVPAQFDNSPYGYVSFETLEWFGETFGFNELQIVAKPAPDGRMDKAYAQEVVSRVKSKAEKTGMVIPLSMAAEPGQLPLDDILQAVLMLMGVLGLLSLFLSAFLIVNTITALLTQQRRQIGVMKALGARTSQITAMYLVMAMLYGLAALVLAIPFSRLGALGLSRLMANMFNFDLRLSAFPFSVTLIQVLVGLGLPVLASLYPLLANLRQSAAQTISTYQVAAGSQKRGGWIARLLSSANLWFARQRLTRPLLLSLRNTFRSPGRLALTLATLTLASALFMSVFNVRAAMFTSVDDLMQLFNFDLQVAFEQPYRVEKIAAYAQAVPGVQLVDTWNQIPIRLVRPDGSESGSIYLFAPRVDSPLHLQPKIVSGRWIDPGDGQAIVVSGLTLVEEPYVQLGRQITLKINGKEQHFRVVGVTVGVMLPMMYADSKVISQAAGDVGQANTALVVTRSHDPQEVTRVRNQLELRLKEAGFQVNSIQSMHDEREEGQATFDLIISLLLVMALLLALVGGLGLMGTMSINVLERRREIGVLRAIGAPGRGVEQVFIREGIAIGLLSWGVGMLLAQPFSQMLCNAVGQALLGAPIAAQVSATGIYLWLILVLLLSIIASLLPARSAARLTVREVLAYE